MLSKTDGGTADIIVDTIIGLTRFPQIFAFAEDPFCVRVSAEICVKRGVVSGKVKTWR